MHPYSKLKVAYPNYKPIESIHCHNHPFPPPPTKTPTPQKEKKKIQTNKSHQWVRAKKKE